MCLDLDLGLSLSICVMDVITPQTFYPCALCARFEEAPCSLRAQWGTLDMEPPVPCAAKGPCLQGVSIQLAPDLHGHGSLNASDWD
jgi:hypothetical protein